LHAPAWNRLGFDGATDRGQRTEREGFRLDKVHDFHLEVPAKEWATMQKVENGRTIFGPKKFVPNQAKTQSSGT